MFRKKKIGEGMARERRKKGMERKIDRSTCVTTFGEKGWREGRRKEGH